MRWRVEEKKRASGKIRGPRKGLPIACCRVGSVEPGFQLTGMDSLDWSGIAAVGAVFQTLRRLQAIRERSVSPISAGLSATTTPASRRDFFFS